MIPQGGDDGDGALIESLEEHLRFLESPEVCEVSSKGQDVGVLRGAAREGAASISAS